MVEEDWAQHLGLCSAEASSHKLSASQFCWFKKRDISQHEGFIEVRRRDRKLVFSLFVSPSCMLWYFALERYIL